MDDITIKTNNPIAEFAQGVKKNWGINFIYGGTFYYWWYFSNILPVALDRWSSFDVGMGVTTQWSVQIY